MTTVAVFGGLKATIVMSGRLKINKTKAPKQTRRSKVKTTVMMLGGLKATIVTGRKVEDQKDQIDKHRGDRVVPGLALNRDHGHDVRRPVGHNRDHGKVEDHVMKTS